MKMSNHPSISQVQEGILSYLVLIIVISHNSYHNNMEIQIQKA